MRKFIIIAFFVIIVATITLGFSLRVSAQQSPLAPSWIKNVAKWWVEGQTSDSEFVAAFQYLIDHNIIHASSSDQYHQLNNVTTGQLSQRLDDLQARYDTLQAQYNTLLRQVQNITTVRQTLSFSETGNESISAVAVKPVISSDTFFETTTYQGTILKISVAIREGTGLVLVNTAIPTGVDFQTSARTAVMVAQKITDVDLSKKDIIFSINAAGNNQDLQAVDGGSAGGAMTVLLISDILAKPINGQVLMTGTIQSDGTIGPIGAVSEKADAAGNYGAKIFLVPQGQGVIPVQTCTERTEGPFVYQSCTTEEKALSPITESKYGMKVVEINNITDALKYFNST